MRAVLKHDLAKPVVIPPAYLGLDDGPEGPEDLRPHPASCPTGCSGLAGWTVALCGPCQSL